MKNTYLCCARRPVATCSLAVPLIAMTLLLTGCATPPPYQKPPIEVAAAFKESSLWKTASPGAATVPDDWWLLFNDPVLNDLQNQVALGSGDVGTPLDQAGRQLDGNAGYIGQRCRSGQGKHR